MGVIKLQRVKEIPILKPNKKNEWECASCFNSAAIREDDTVHLFYRATNLNCNGGENNEYLNYIGHATSSDGINFKREDEYVLGPEKNTQWERGCEDPRITKIDGRFYIVYTGFADRFPGDFRICMSQSSDLKNWENPRVLLDETNKDAALFPCKLRDEYVLLHRRAPDIWISSSKDLKQFDNHKILATPTNNYWENYKIGIAGPPIETPKGFILIYHGVSKDKKSFGKRGEYGQYSLGIMLLDKDNPEKIIYRQEEPILEPELDWELNGNVPNVVFSCGQVVMGEDLFVYYAGADESIGAAKVKMKEIMELF